jgi:L-alanine-DL-glutamate epimerase-like enolase superfamily enzyme
MKISGIDCHVLLDPDYDVDATSSAQDDLVVEIHTDEGVTGIGETDVNPWIGRACIEAPSTHTMGLGLSDMLIGQNPLEVEAIWEQLYVGSAMNGRRGAVINAIGAIDMALHDLRGKLLGKPCYELLAGRPGPNRGAVRGGITPYASLQPEVSGFDAYCESMVRWAIDARQYGFHALKLEVTLSGPYAHMGLREPYERAAEVIRAVRNAVGPDVVIMVDVQYAFPDAETCLNTIRDWQQYDLFFVETPLWPDDLDGYALVAGSQSIPIAAGEWLTTRFEFLDLMDRGKIGVAQPDIGRVGGLTEARRVCDLAAQRELTVVPHLWNTGISIAAAVHLAAATPQCPFIEFLPVELSHSSLRKDLLSREHTLVDGVIPLPSSPGLGIELNRDALGRFKEAAEREMRDRRESVPTSALRTRDTWSIP